MNIPNQPSPLPRTAFSEAPLKNKATFPSHRRSSNTCHQRHATVGDGNNEASRLAPCPLRSYREDQQIKARPGGAPGWLAFRGNPVDDG